MTLRATKVRIYPDKEQLGYIERQFGAVRFVYNRALHIGTHYYRVKGQKLHPVYDLKKLLSVAKKNRRYSWLSDFDAMALQQGCINLNKAYQNFFARRAKYPRFKRKQGYQSSYHCTGRLKVGAGWIQVPKFPGKIQAKVHREIEGAVKSITLSRTPTGKYFASILVETGEITPAKPDILPEQSIRGIDMGLTHLMIDDQGKKVANPRHLRNAQANLRQKQKALSRKKKGSKNRVKARVHVAKAHERVANARHDFQHKISRQMVDENQAIIAETLKIKNMLKNRRLAKSISDAAWGSLLEKVKYKAEEQGRIFLKINQWEATTKTCSCCGHKVAKLPLNVRSWECPSCGEEHDRDVNAAINVKRVGIEKLRASGLRVPACGGLRKTVHETAAANEAGKMVASATGSPRL